MRDLSAKSQPTVEERLQRRNGRSERPSTQQTRERILSAAARLFAEQGFASASMPAIAELSGITAGAIYRHFSSKAELLLEVVKSALRSSPLSAYSAKGAEESSILPEIAASYTDPGLKLVRQLSLEVHAAASRDKDVNRLLSEYGERATRRVRDSIALGQRSGKINPKLDPEFTARILTSMIMGLNHMDTLNPHLVGDRGWREFVAERIGVLLGIRPV